LIEQIEVFPQVAAEGNPSASPHLQPQADFTLQVDTIIATSTNGGHTIDGFMVKNDLNAVVVTLAITWPQGAIDQIIIRMVAAQVDSDVSRVQLRPFYAFASTPRTTLQFAFHPWSGNSAMHRILPYLAMASGFRKTHLGTSMPHAIFQQPLQWTSSAICNMSRASPPELMRCAGLPISRQN
jgi:hypothetical protein